MNPLGVVQEFYRAMAAGQIEKVVALLSPDLQWEEAERFPYYGGVWKNPQAVVDNLFTALQRIGKNSRRRRTTSSAATKTLCRSGFTPGNFERQAAAFLPHSRTGGWFAGRESPSSSNIPTPPWFLKPRLAVPGKLFPNERMVLYAIRPRCRNSKTSRSLAG